MTISARRLSTAIALSAALVLAPALTGCGAIEGIIEQASGGEINVSIGELPDGWPAEVPVIDGDILGGGTTPAENGTKLWNVTIKVADTAAFDDITAQLNGAGFEAVEAGELDGGETVTSGAFKNDTYGVFVAVTGSGDNFVANYTVAEGEPVTG